MKLRTVGSLCSGIEAASVAWKPLGLKFKWFSENASFPSQVLLNKYPDIRNLGNMELIPDMILSEEIAAPDILCAGTPCQAFSYAGWKNGLKDDRGNLTLKFVDAIEANDIVRSKKFLDFTVVFWENVEGVLTDKTNAFGCFISSLAGLSKVIEMKKWPKAGILKGSKRNIAWRVLDSKYFGLPQQRRRLYLLAGGKNFFPENILFEKHENELVSFPPGELLFTKDGHCFEIFREYTDCLYSSYGTKWNGNAAARNGSLFVVQDERIRRFSPLECERLMGFPDNYTNIPGATRTSRYKALGNSWSVNVVHWLGKRLISKETQEASILDNNVFFESKTICDATFYDFQEALIQLNNDFIINCSEIPENVKIGSIKEIISTDVPDKLYISPTACFGILRRSIEGNSKLNKRLKKNLMKISSELSIEEIEKRSRIQRRGKFSTKNANEIFEQLKFDLKEPEQISFIT